MREDFDAHWHDPKPDWPLIVVLTKIGAILVVICMILAMLIWGLTSAHAHMHDRPDLNAWFDSLKGAGGMPCCSQIDGSTVADPDWETAMIGGRPHYRVRVEGQWIVVTDEEVVQGPNKYGQPLVWVYHVDGKPAIRCFMPGTMG